MAGLDVSIEVFWLCVLALSTLLVIMSGIPVMIAIAGTPLVIAFVASALGHFDLTFLAAYPQRIIGVMSNPLLIAVPLFVLMGVLLEHSRQAEKLLLDLTTLIGQTRNSVVLAILVVSTLIAASTGIIGASVDTAPSRKADPNSG